MTPPLYYSCHRLLSLSPFLSLLFGPISFLRSPAVSKSSTLLFSLSSFPVHLSQSSSSILLSVYTNLPLYPSKHCVPHFISLPLPLYPLLLSLFFYLSTWYSNGALCHRVHFSIIPIVDLFISEYQKYISFEKIYNKKKRKRKKEALLKMSKAVFILSAWALHLDKQHVHLPNNTPCDCSRGKQGGNTLFVLICCKQKAKKCTSLTRSLKWA